MSDQRFQRRVEITHELSLRDYHDVTFGHENSGDPSLLKRDPREYVGGLWEEMGQLQLDFLLSQGLRPEHKVLDVGCGSFRAGRLLIDYLEPGNYFGIDINHEILEVGYDQELTEAQRARLPHENIHSTDRFDCTFGENRFDFALAQSVFSHISMNAARLCLHRLGEVMDPGARFFATFIERPLGTPLDSVSGRIFSERDIFWNYRGDLRYIARETPWSYRYIGDWGHPRDQRMVEYTRLSDAQVEERKQRRTQGSHDVPPRTSLLRGRRARPAR